MIWIIASVPFWIVGAGFLITGSYGIVVTIGDASSMSDAAFKKACISILFCMFSAGGLFLLAAKICS